MAALKAFREVGLGVGEIPVVSNCGCPSGPEVVCSESLLSRDREGAVQGLSAYKRSRTYGTKH